MPGFNIGGGGSGNEPSNVTETRRKHRWVFQTVSSLSRESLLFLKSASRPSFKYDDPIMHHDQEEVFFAGKQHWEPITLTWYDAEQNPNVSNEIHKWIQTVTTSGLGSGGGQIQVATPREYKKEATLTSTTGTGSDNEKWALKGVWPQQVDFQDLDYTNTEIQLVTATMRFDRAVREQ
jgi:hypothetical protein